MKKRRQPKETIPQQFQKGQIWQMEDSNLQIALVGKTLVHFKRYKTQARGGTISLASKDSLEKLLKSKKARLIQP